MFERFGDLPLHVLVIHVAVVLLPTAALSAIVFALVPKWRWFLRWPVLLLALGSAAVAFVARQSGKAFLKAKPDLGQIIQTHQSRGDLLFWYSLGFAFITILAVLWLSGPSALASGRGEKAAMKRPVEYAVSAGLVVMALLVAWQTVRTGDAGAKAVWDGTFSS